MTRDVAEQRLVAARATTLCRIEAMTADLDTAAAAASGSNLDDEHDPEGATVAFEREQLAALRTQAQHNVEEVDAALARLATGQYGRCERCAGPVTDERLDALPATRYCVRCAASQR